MDLLTSLTISSLHHRSGQVGVPAGPREPGNLSESLRPNRALLQHWRRRSVSCSCCWSAAAAVPVSAVWGPDGRLPAIMPPQFLCSTAIPTCAHLSHSLPTATIKGYGNLGSLPPSPTQHQRDWFNHNHDYKNETSQEQVYVLVSNMGQVLQSCQPVSKGVSNHSALRWAHLCAWTPPTGLVPSIFHLQTVPVTPPIPNCWTFSSFQIFFFF